MASVRISRQDESGRVGILGLTTSRKVVVSMHEEGGAVVAEAWLTAQEARQLLASLKDAVTAIDMRESNEKRKAAQQH